MHMRIIVQFDACAFVSSGKRLGGVAAARKDVRKQFDHCLPAQRTADRSTHVHRYVRIICDKCCRHPAAAILLIFFFV